jgi:ABC-2 type transport system ATP-binding protein
MIEIDAPDPTAYDVIRNTAVQLNLGLVRVQERHHRIEDVFRSEEAGSVQPV